MKKTKDIENKDIVKKFLFLYKTKEFKVCAYDLNLPYEKLNKIISCSKEGKKKYIAIKFEKLQVRKIKFLQCLWESNKSLTYILSKLEINNSNYRYWLKVDSDFRAKIDKVLSIRNKNKLEIGRYIA